MSKVVKQEIEMIPLSSNNSNLPTPVPGNSGGLPPDPPNVDIWKESFCFVGGSLGGFTGSCVNAGLFTGIGFCIAGPVGGAAGYTIGLFTGFMGGVFAGYRGTKWALDTNKD